MRRFVSYGPALVVLMTVVAVLVAAPAAVRRIESARTGARIVLAQRSLDDDDILERLNRATRNISDTVLPSVVHIEVIPEGGRRFARSTGSGWVYDAAGHIVTNAHVVKGASAISVQFSDGRVVDAEKIHDAQFVADPFTDIAVIRVPSSDDIFPARRATGIQPQQGDHVYVFGSPFGFKFSMSQGIVSGLGRDPQSAAEVGGFTNFIQTDAAVNPGNSGGPLVDIKGRVIGMNVAIATGRNAEGTTGDEGQSAGISFAIPLGTIESVVSQLIDTGEVRRGFMGISANRRDDSVPVTRVPGFRGTGALVGDVTKDGPAEKGGVRSGDVIVEINGQRSSDWQVLRSLISSERPGSAVRLKVARDGALRDLTVTLEDRPTDLAANMDMGAARWSLARYGLGLRQSDAGPVIGRVADDSPAADAGFKAQQAILSVGGKPVHDVSEVLAAAADGGLLLGRRVAFEVADTDEQSSSAPQTIEVQVLR
jgi:serine protease Do